MAISQEGRVRLVKVADWLALFLPIIIMVLTAIIYEPKRQVPVVDHLQVKNTFAEKWFALLLVLWFLLSYWRGKIIIANNKIAYALYALFALGGVSILWSVFTGHTLTKILLWFAPAALIFMFYQGVKNEKHLDYVVQGVFWAGFAVAILGCGQYLFGWDFVAQAANPCSTFGNKNMACHMVVLAIPVAFYLIFAKEQETWKDVLYALALMIMAAFLFYTRTRSAWGAVAAELVILVLFMLLGGYKHLQLNTKKISIVGAAIFGFILMATLNESFLAEGRSMFVPAMDIFSKEAGSAIQGAQGGNIRFVIWPAAIELFQHAPWIGHGLGTFFYVYPETYELQGHAVRYAHNEYLELAVELGIAGLLVLLSCIGLILWSILTLLKKAGSADKVLTIVILAALLGTSLNAMYSFVYAHIAPMLLLGSLLFLLMVLTERYGNKNSVDFFIGRAIEYNTVKKTIFIPLVLVIAVAIYVLNLYWQSHIDTMNQNIKQHKWQTKIELPKNELLQLPNYSWIFYGASKGFSNSAPSISFNAAKTLYEVYPRHYNNNMLLARFYLRWGAVDKAMPVIENAIAVRPRGTIKPLMLKLQVLGETEGNSPRVKETLETIMAIYKKESAMPLTANPLQEEMQWVERYLSSINSKDR